MAACVAAIQSTPGGPYILQLDPSHADLSTCSYLVEDGTSNGWRELGNLSMDQATQIGITIGLVWAGAWGIKQIVRAIRTTDASDLAGG